MFGYIAEAWVGQDDERNRLFRRWNRRVLAQLPEEDVWPPLPHSLFAWTELNPLMGGYRGSIIHFGGRFKSIEQEWDEWLRKYEELLRRLYWESSVVHLDTEGGGSYRFTWWLGSWDSLLATPPQLPTTWEFCGHFAGGVWLAAHSPQRSMQRTMQHELSITS